MKQSILLFLVISVCLLFSCSKTEEFKIQGLVSGAAYDTLYIERVEMGKVEVLASHPLSKKGEFRFSFARPAEPQYLRLRLQQRLLYLVADSTETISVYSHKQSFGQSDSIVGSEGSKRMQYIVQRVAQTQQQIQEIQQKYQLAQISATIFTQETSTIIQDLKSFLRQEVYKDTRSSVAYFALYQQVNGYYLFDPYDKEDVKVYAAVATPLQVHYPETSRSRNIEDVVLKGMQRRKNAEDKIFRQQVGKSFIEIALPNIHGKTVSLAASLGQVTVLDFSLFQSESSYAHSVLLQELYRVYAPKGLRIYQISFDDYKVFSVAAKQFPYTVVHDKNELLSNLLDTYNITTLPTIFLLDREGNILARNVSIPVLETSIKQLLQD
jgi:peroxiredoxin